jgi:hypothetical protein
MLNFVWIENAVELISKREPLFWDSPNEMNCFKNESIYKLSFLGEIIFAFENLNKA